MRSIKVQLIRGVMAVVLALTGVQAWAFKCDVDNNGRIDRVDIGLIQQAALARTPVTGPDDPRDSDNNLVINTTDGRICALRCKYANCATNGAPRADAGVDQTVRVGETVRLNGAASSDPDGDTLTYTWVLQTRPAGSAAALTGAATINPSFVADRAGSYTLALVVGDGTTSSAADTVTISTSNSAPVANAGPDQSARVGDTVVLDGRASSDVDGDTLSYAWRIVSAPGGSSAALIDPTTVQPRLTIDVAGSYELELTVSDGTTTSAADRVLVSTLNTAPVARPGSNQAVALGALVQLNGSASSDVDGDTLTYAWSLSTRPAGSTAVLTAPSSVNPSFVADRPGTYVAQLIVNDGSLSSAPASVTITTDNAAPSANAGPDQTVPLGALVQLSGSASTDPEGQPLTYAWSLTTRPAGSTAVLDSSTAAGPRFTADRPGTYIAQLIVSDGTLASAPDTVIISTQNSRPVADAGAPQAVDTGATVQLNGSGSRDADGDPLTYSWSFTSRPAGSAAAISPANAAQPAFVADLPGTYVAQLIVSDGTLASVPVTVTITVTTPNRPPVAAASATPATVNVGSAVTLSAAGSSDPDGNPLSYAWSIASRPVGSVAAISGATSATASFVPDVAGAYTLQLTVSDGSLSASALASVTANAVATNRPPVIVTVPGTVATVAAPYAYDVDATDPDAGDTLTYSLTAAPANMSINPSTGLINWSPTPVQVGSQPVTVRVTDAAGLFATQSYSITVGSQPTALELSAAINPAIANAGQSVTLTTLVSGGNGGAVTLSATLDGTPLVLTAGSATFAAPAAGVHTVRVTATGSAVNGQTPAPQTRELILTVRDASDTTAPVAAITSPATDTEVLQPVPVIGTASDARFAYYQLLLKPAGAAASAWVEIRRGLSPVTAGTLGTLDPTKIANGVYDLGLNVVDVNGRASSAQVTIEIARDRKIGQFRISFTDINASAAGLPLTLNRTYDSLKKDIQGDFGFGWSADANDTSVRKNMVLGLSWQLQTSGFNQCLRPIGNRRVTVTLPDGGVYRFQARNEPQCRSFVPPEVSIVFDPLPLPVGGSTGGGAGVGTLEIASLPSLVEFRGGMLFDWDALDAWNPTDYTFTSSEGMKYTLREGVGVIAMADRYGNRVDYGPTGYQHNSTLGVQLVRDAQGRITRATDPAGRSLNYAYNTNGELASVTDRAGQITYFQYDTATSTGGAGDTVNSRHLLASITDPRGLIVLRQQFDEFGRLSGVSDGNGDGTSQTYDEANNQQRVVDRRGNATTYTFDAAGNVSRIADARGGITDLTYDANGNELTRRDPLGNTVTKTFNAVTGKVLTESDPLGRVTTIGYPTTGKDFERQNPVSVSDPLGRVVTFGYRAGESTFPGALPNSITEPLGRVTSMGIDAKGNLTSMNVAGITTTYVYDAKGRRTRETDGAGNATNITFDDNGNELTRSVTRTVAGVPRTETITRVYDSENRLIQETDATGAVRRTTYNAAGLKSTSVDALGRTTTYTYDANSRLVRTDFPDGTNEQIEYDANGNKVGSTDRLGRVTLMGYDELNRLVSTTLPDGSVRSLEYDAAGRMTAEVDERGARKSHEYDAASQHKATVDASGRRTEHSYDLAGNRTQTRLPDGRLITYTFDALNRLTRTDYPDGSFESSTYRPDGRRLTETDTRGVTTTFGYDAAGRMTSVVQTGVPVATTFSFDETSARTAQTDGSAHTSQWRYDAAGRPVARILPDGSTESFSYDAEGRITGSTTFGGQAIVRTYDSVGRETSRTVPATATAPARSISWTYSADGQRLTQTETGAGSTQGTTTYTYDALRRITSMTGPLGTLSWGYDEAGHVTRRTTSEGSTNYQYDGDGRLTLLTAPDGRTTTYAYDAAGRMVRSEQQLDTGAGIVLVSERRFDAQDRQIAVAHSRRVASVTTLLAGQAVQRDAGGAVTRIDTFDGAASYNAGTGVFTGAPIRVQAFTHDSNARLAAERHYKGADLTAWLANNAAPATQVTTYVYDNVGNRTTRSVVTAAGTESTAYAYDSNDRLTSETLTTTTGSTIVTTYSWDGNGNLAAKQSPAEYTGYVFDAENRLIEVRRGPTPGTAQSVASYGYDADGQRISKTTPSGTTKFLIDPTTSWPEVVLETRTGGTGTQVTGYVWGHDLRQQARGGQGTLFGSPTEDLVPLVGHLGTAIGAVRRDATVAEQYESNAFGESANTNPRLTHQFTGQYGDTDAQLVQLRARWMDPSTGRMLSVDPGVGRRTEPATLNRYVYAVNDPLHAIDPSGWMSMGEISVGQSISASLNTGAQFYGRLVLRKVGCELISIGAEEAVTAVIYVFLDGVTGLPYVGQTTQGVDTRLQQHIDEGKRTVKQVLARFEVVADRMRLKDQLRLAEQFVIDELGGLANLSNDVNAISKTRGRLRGAFSKLCK